MKVCTAFGRWGALCGVLIAGIFLAGCRTHSNETAFAEVPGMAPVSTTAPASAGASDASTASAGTQANPEIFSPGDTLTIVYNDLPIVVPNFDGQIKTDGTITLILNQAFQVVGKTRGQLEKEIRDRYVPAYFKNMTVTIKPKEDTRIYFVGGEVKSPGRQLYITGITVTKAIQSAGDFTDFANKKKVKLIRQNGRVETVNCLKALNDPSLDQEVYPGDKIHVDRKIW